MHSLAHKGEEIKVKAGWNFIVYFFFLNLFTLIASCDGRERNM